MPIALKRPGRIDVAPRNAPANAGSSEPRPTVGLGSLLPAFAGAFLGATSIRPGRFNAIGTLIAVYLVATGITGLQQQGAEPFVQQLFNGAALLIAVTLARLARRTA